MKKKKKKKTALLILSSFLVRMHLSPLWQASKQGSLAILSVASSFSCFGQWERSEPRLLLPRAVPRACAVGVLAPPPIS